MRLNSGYSFVFTKPCSLFIRPPQGSSSDLRTPRLEDNGLRNQAYLPSPSKKPQCQAKTRSLAIGRPPTCLQAGLTDPVCEAGSAD